MSLVDYQPDPAARPTITRREANWHAHVAGMRASEAATAAGGDPAAIDALSGSGPVVIGGISIPPLTIATFWSLREVAKSCDITGIGSQMISLLAFLDPEAVRQAGKAGDIAWLEDEAFRLASTITPLVYAEIGRHIDAQLATMQSLGGSSDDSPEAPAGKPPAANSVAS